MNRPLTDMIQNLGYLFEDVAALRAEHPRVKVRIIDADDVRELISRLSAITPAPGDVRLTARIHGGFVPGSYKGTAEADHLTVDIDLISGETRTTVRRAAAQRRSGGKGERMIIRLAREGQVSGRIV